MDPSSFRCPTCDYVDRLDGLRRHCVRSHGINAESLYRTLFMDGKQPTCACGCGEIITKFWGIEKGFSRFVRGHQSRVHNNWGHNSGAQARSQDVRREMHRRGEIRIWNRGETKQTSVRVAEVAKVQSANFTPERRARRAAIMKRSWEIGAITPLTGSTHPGWKGGASALQPVVRSRLHYAWAYPKLTASGFKCTACNAPGLGLCVHHDQERFASILQRAIGELGEPGDDFERKSAIADWVVAYHIEHDVSGVVLCEACHKLQHATVG